VASARCGYQRKTGRACQQKVAANSRNCAAGHLVVPRDETGKLSTGACEITETREGWVYKTHDLDSERWRVAIALGAIPPCQVPGGLQTAAKRL